MICPHCYRTIEDHEQNLMAMRVPREEPVNFKQWWFVIPGLLLLGFVIAYGLFDAVGRLTG